MSGIGRAEAPVKPNGVLKKPGEIRVVIDPPGGAREAAGTVPDKGQDVDARIGSVEASQAELRTMLSEMSRKLDVIQANQTQELAVEDSAVSAGRLAETRASLGTAAEDKGQEQNSAEMSATDGVVSGKKPESTTTSGKTESSAPNFSRAHDEGGKYEDPRTATTPTEAQAVAKQTADRAYSDRLAAGGKLFQGVDDYPGSGTFNNAIMTDQEKHTLARANAPKTESTSRWQRVKGLFKRTDQAQEARLQKDRDHWERVMGRAGAAGSNEAPKQTQSSVAQGEAPSPSTQDSVVNVGASTQASSSVGEPGATGASDRFSMTQEQWKARLEGDTGKGGPGGGEKSAEAVVAPVGKVEQSVDAPTYLSDVDILGQPQADTVVETVKTPVETGSVDAALNSTPVVDTGATSSEPNFARAHDEGGKSEDPTTAATPTELTTAAKQQAEDDHTQKLSLGDRLFKGLDAYPGETPAVRASTADADHQRNVADAAADLSKMRAFHESQRSSAEVVAPGKEARSRFGRLANRFRTPQ
ncbi:MAG: hypothetical protein RLZZ455_995 [Candidatus Parcubacteria bacterium]|jgi:hypothetical protein